MSKPRYALYFSPADDSVLAVFGEQALKRRPDGRDSDLGPVFGAPDGGDHRQRAAFPRHYGFHATLKAPFELAEGAEEVHLKAALERFCEQHKPVDLPGLGVQQVQERFLALTCRRHDALQDLAFAVVSDFESYRAPLSVTDRARRKPEQLSTVERMNLDRFGYPFVGKAFAFHMTLSGSAEPSFLAFLEDLFAQTVNRPQRLDHLGLFYQPDRDSVFVRIAHHRLG